MWVLRKVPIISIFLSTLSLRRATVEGDNFFYYADISIHALLAESDSRRALGFVDPDISIHALLAESDSSRIISSSITAYFYPRSPCGERLWVLRKVPILGIFLSTLLAESDPPMCIIRRMLLIISIHALLAESDLSR
mgnify:CR=1 FL=1